MRACTLSVSSRSAAGLDVREGRGSAACAEAAAGTVATRPESSTSRMPALFNGGGSAASTSEMPLLFRTGGATGSTKGVPALFSGAGCGVSTSGMPCLADGVVSVPADFSAAMFLPACFRCLVTSSSSRSL